MTVDVESLKSDSNLVIVIAACCTIKPRPQATPKIEISDLETECSRGRINSTSKQEKNPARCARQHAKFYRGTVLKTLKNSGALRAPACRLSSARSTMHTTDSA